MKSQNLHLNRKCLAACNPPGRSWQGSLAMVKHQWGAGKLQQPGQTLLCSLAPLQGGDVALCHTLTALTAHPRPPVLGAQPRVPLALVSTGHALLAPSSPHPAFSHLSELGGCKGAWPSQPGPGTGGRSVEHFRRSIN